MHNQMVLITVLILLALVLVLEGFKKLSEKRQERRKLDLWCMQVGLKKGSSREQILKCFELPNPNDVFLK